MKKYMILLFAIIIMWQLLFLTGCEEKEVVFSPNMENNQKIANQSDTTNTEDTSVESTIVAEEEADSITKLESDNNIGSDVDSSKNSSIKDETNENPELYYIHIFGEVVTPGVYCVNPGARVYEVIEMAGGFTRQADENYVNLADLVTDGQKIKIYSIEEAKENIEKGISQDSLESPLAAEEMENVTEKVNINTAAESELCTLPGVGQGKAKSIITYREENGGFGSIEEIMQVAGIKEGTYNGLKDMITVEN